MSRGHGTFILLHWEDVPTAYYVRGHVSPDEFMRAIEPHLWTEVDGYLRVTKVEHAFARWIPTPHGVCPRMIWERPKKERGCFPVTVVRRKEL